MKVTSRETYKVIRAVLEKKKFTQYEISKTENVTFSLVNKVVNWLLGHNYVAKRTGNYELVAAAGLFGIFPLFRKMKPYAAFEVDLSKEEVLKMMKAGGRLCLTSALQFHDAYFRDPVIHAYIDEGRLIDELKHLPKGYTRIEAYHEDLNSQDFEKKEGFVITSKTRTIIDLFCSNKAYASQRLIKKEWA